MLLLFPFVLATDVALPCLEEVGHADTVAIGSSLSSSIDSGFVGRVHSGSGIDTLLKSCGLGGNCGGCVIPQVGNPRMQSRCTAV